MSALAQSKNIPSQSKSVTAISAVARVDYILRFSKHAVLVVDEDAAACSEIGSRYLANLPEEHNAAYITMSSQLNNLQVRCRLIEQLFGQVLFDPEQSIAVSLINLVKQQNQSVSIVVDNAHHLSLQLIHELSQLAEIAKKADYHINVLLLGLPSAGILVHQHQSLFNKKLSIVAAVSGQLIAHNSPIFKPKSQFFTMTPFKKWATLVVSLFAVSMTTIVMMYQRDVLSFSAELTPTPVAKTPVLLGKKLVIDNNNTQQSVASVGDIFNAVSDPASTKEQPPKIIQHALPIDVLKAIDSINDETVSNSSSVVNVSGVIEPQTSIINSASSLETEKNSSSLVMPDVQNTSIKSDKDDGYLAHQQGFVIQLGVFTQSKVLAEFIEEFNQIAFDQYHRTLNGQELTVLTTGYFQTREQAQTALSELPQTILERSPWIKGIRSINDEIKRFERSQSGINKVTIPTS